MSKNLNNIIFENVSQSNKVFTQHFHNTYSIGLTHQGMFKSINQNNSYNSYAYSTRINNPEELHGGEAQDWNNSYFYPSVQFMSDLYYQIFDEKKVPYFIEHIIDDFILYKKLKKVFLSQFLKEENIVLETNIIDALSYLIKKYGNKSKDINNHFNEKEVIKNSISLIKDTITEPLNLDMLSNNAKLSKFHFLRIFKKELGLTPHQYILIQRIEKAKALIYEGNSISESAIKVGFNDQSHFNRNFKRFYSYTPGQLLRK